MSEVSNLYICDAHGAGINECCVNAEVMGTMEYKGAVAVNTLVEDIEQYVREYQDAYGTYGTTAD